MHMIDFCEQYELSSLKITAFGWIVFKIYLYLSFSLGRI